MSSRPIQVLGGLLAGILLIGGLAGCASDQEKYCSAVKADLKRFATLLDGDGPGRVYGLITARTWLGDLADQAPEDLSDEWQTLLTAIDGLAAAVRRTGHPVADFADGVPAGVSRAERSALGEAADALTSAQTVAAANGIETQARDVCKVNLSL